MHCGVRGHTGLRRIGRRWRCAIVTYTRRSDCRNAAFLLEILQWFLSKIRKFPLRQAVEKRQSNSYCTPGRLQGPLQDDQDPVRECVCHQFWVVCFPALQAHKECCDVLGGYYWYPAAGCVDDFRWIFLNAD